MIVSGTQDLMGASHLIKGLHDFYLSKGSSIQFEESLPQAIRLSIIMQPKLKVRASMIFEDPFTFSMYSRLWNGVKISKALGGFFFC
jgi:hypothetical protein